VRDRDFSVYELACWNTDRRAREADNSIWTTIAAGKCDYYGERAERKSLMRHSDFHVLSYFFRINFLFLIEYMQSFYFIRYRVHVIYAACCYRRSSVVCLLVVLCRVRSSVQRTLRWTGAHWRHLASTMYRSVRRQRCGLSLLLLFQLVFRCSWRQGAGRHSCSANLLDDSARRPGYFDR